MRRLPAIALLFLARAAFGVSFPETALDAPVYFTPTALQLRLGAAVAAGGSSYLVAWEERASLQKPPSIYIRALDGNGVPQQPMAVLVGRGGAPAIAWSGSEYLLVWSNGTAVEAVRVSEAGAVFEGTHVVVTTAAGGRAGVAWNGSRYAVVWGDGGALLDRYGIIAGSLPAASAVVAIGGDFVFASGQTLRTGSGSVDVGHPILALTTNGTTVAAYWSTGISLGINVYDAALKPLRTYSTGVPVAGSLAAVQLGDEHLAVTASSRTAANELVSYGRVGDSTGIFWFEHGAPSNILEPALASNGTTTLLVYSERRSGVDEIKVAVADHPWLTPSIAKASVVSTTGTAGSAPAVALGDDRVLVAFAARHPGSETMDVVVGGATFTGVALPRHVVVSIDHPADLTITRAGERYLVMWTDSDPYWHEGPMGAAIVDRDGNVLAGPMPLLTGGHPTAASNGTSWLIAWQEHARISGLGSAVGIETIASDGTQGPAVIRVVDFFRFEPFVAWDGRDYVVLWSESLGLRQRERIAVMRSDVDGNPRSETPTILEESFVDSLRGNGIVASGGHLFVIWTRGEKQLVASADLGAPFTAVTAAQAIASPRVAAAPNGHAAVMYRAGDSPLTLAYVAPDRGAGTVGLISNAISWDFAFVNDSIVMAYERPAAADEELGSSAVFARGLQLRRHVSR